VKVVHEPITLLVDPLRCELAILTGGIRIAMTGEEAGTFWAELGDALKKIYAERADRCPSKVADLLLREFAISRPPPSAGNTAALEQALARVIAYAQRPSATPDDATAPSALLGAPPSQPHGPAAGQTAIDPPMDRLTDARTGVRPRGIVSSVIPALRKRAGPGQTEKPRR
jgi:hypothetical protein